MSNLFNRFLFISFLFIGFISCKKDGPQLTANGNAAFSGSLKSSVDSVTLTPATDNDTVVTFSWPAVNYGSQPVVSYSIQYDTLGDTSGTKAWGNAQTIALGNYVVNYSLTGKTLNSMMNALALPPDVATPLAFRIISNLNQQNGSASSVPAVYSSTLTLPVTPYPLSLYVPGAYQNWDPTMAPFLNPVVGVPGKFEGYYYMPGTGVQYFKYTNAPDWNHLNYGDSSIDGLMTTDGNAGGLYVANGGYIEVTADFNTSKWTATATTWGILGDATPGGWNTDTQMSYDPTTQLWTVTAYMLQAGSFKFRANDAWNIDFGIDASGNLQYADNPFFTYNPSLNNLTVPSDGTYLITLDLHVSGKYNYSLVKM